MLDKPHRLKHVKHVMFSKFPTITACRICDSMLWNVHSLPGSHRVIYLQNMLTSHCCAWLRSIFHPGLTAPSELTHFSFLITLHIQCFPQLKYTHEFHTTRIPDFRNRPFLSQVLLIMWLEGEVLPNQSCKL